MIKKIDFLISSPSENEWIEFKHNFHSPEEIGERIAACYQHACLKYVSNEKMSNESLRERFSIDPKNSAQASRIIRETLNNGLIKKDDPENSSRKYKRYIPYWA